MRLGPEGLRRAACALSVDATAAAVGRRLALGITIPVFPPHHTLPATQIWDTFMESIEPFARHIPYMVGAGNHGARAAGLLGRWTAQGAVLQARATAAVRWMSAEACTTRARLAQAIHKAREPRGQAPPAHAAPKPKALLLPCTLCRVRL